MVKKEVFEWIIEFQFWCRSKSLICMHEDLWSCLIEDNS